MFRVTMSARYAGTMVRGTRVGVLPLSLYSTHPLVSAQRRHFLFPSEDRKKPSSTPKVLDTAFHFSRKLDPPATRAATDSAVAEKQPAIRRREKLNKEEDVPQPGEAQQEIRLGVMQGGQAVIDRAFERFSSGIGGCTKEEFLLGAQEMYFNVSSLTEYLTELSKDEKYTTTLIKDDLPNISIAAKQIDERFQKDFNLPKSIYDTPSDLVQFWNLFRSAEEKKAGKTDSALKDDINKTFASHIPRAVAAITWLVPMSGLLAETIFKMFVDQKKKCANLYTIAGPNDNVISPKLEMFVPFDSANIYITESPREDINIVLSTEFLKNLATRRARGDFVKPGETKDFKASQANEADKEEDEVSTEHVIRVEIQGDKTESADESKAEADTTTKEADEKTEESTDKTESNKSTDPLDDLISVSFKINGIPASSIPADAKAVAVVSLEVMVPPGRYFPAFDWFYKRIANSSSEYERAAVARVVAESIPTWMYSGIDFVKRMFTGKPIQFIFSSGAKRMIGIPENVDMHPPVIRKLLILYMDKSYKWTLSDLLLSEQCYSGLERRGTSMQKMD